MNTYAENIETVEIPFKKLVEWEGNVRGTATEEGIEELAASIANHGLLQSLVVRREPRGKFGVIAGRRRLLALASLVASGTMRATAPIPCRIVNADTDHTELSLAENVVRANMHPADEFEAFQRLLETGKSAADIAARFGVTEAVVLRRLALARVNPTLLQKYRAGEMNLELLQAFTLTDNQQLQEQVWNQLRSWDREPSQVRAMLSQNEIPADDKRVRFVTLQRYEEEGGTVRRDLFAEEEDGVYIQDAVLLSRLVSEKLALLAADLQEDGWKWVEVQPEQNHQASARMRRLSPEPAPLSPKRQAKLTALRQELADLEEQLAQAEEETPEAEDDPRRARVEQLDEQIAQLEAKQKQVYSAESKTRSGAIVALGWNGEPQYTYGLVRKEDEAAFTSKDNRMDANDSIDQSTESSDEEQECSYSASLVEDLSKHKTAAIAAELSQQPLIALAATVHAMAVKHFSFDLRTYSFETSVQVSTTQPHLGPVIESEQSYRVLSDTRTAWLQQLSQESDLWQWCVRQDQETLLRLLAYCVATSVNAVQTKADSDRSVRLQHADRLATTLGVDMTKWFTPTAENFFGRITKPQMVEAMEDAGHTPDSASLSLKKAQLASIAADVVHNTGWLPQPVRIHVVPPEITMEGEEEHETAA